MKPRYKTPRGEFLLMMTLLSFILFVFGGLLNGVAVLKNDCRMPVAWEFKYETDRHFSYQNDSEVNYSFLADNYHISRLYFSIGDVIIILSGISTLIFCLWWSFNLRKRRKEFKKLNG